jgi:hypothetical protein
MTSHVGFAFRRRLFVVILLILLLISAGYISPLVFVRRGPHTLDEPYRTIELYALEQSRLLLEHANLFVPRLKLEHIVYPYSAHYSTQPCDTIMVLETEERIKLDCDFLAVVRPYTLFAIPLDPIYITCRSASFLKP